MNTKLLYYMDPRYDKLVRVWMNDTKNPEIILENEADLKYFVVFKKREGKRAPNKDPGFL